MIKNIFKWIARIVLVLSLIFALLVLIPEKETVKPIVPRESTQYWKMDGGFKIAYSHFPSKSDSSKAPIIFLHGGPGGYIHSSIIETLKPMISTGRDVYLYDQRGSGLSDRMSKFSDVSFDLHVSDLHEIISKHIGVEKAVLIGQSFGSSLIAHFSALNPKMVDKLVFSGPGGLDPIYREDGSLIEVADYPIPDSLEFKRPYSFVSDVDKMAFKPKSIWGFTGALFFDQKWVSDEHMDRMLNTLATDLVKGVVCDPMHALPEEGGGGLYAYLSGNWGGPKDVRKTIPTLDIPALIIQGQCDYIPFSSAYEYVDLYQNATYRFIENAGHDPWLERKEEYRRLIIEFVDQ